MIWGVLEPKTNDNFGIWKDFRGMSWSARKSKGYCADTQNERNIKYPDKKKMIWKVLVEMSSSVQ